MEEQNPIQQQTQQYATIDPTMYYQNNVVIDPKEEYKRDLKKTAGKSAMLLLILGIGGNVLAAIIMFVYTMITTMTAIADGASLNTLDATKMMDMKNGMFIFLTSLLPVIIVDIIIIIIARFIFKLKLSNFFTKPETGIVRNSTGVIVCLAAGGLGCIIASLYMMLFEVLHIEIPALPLSLPEGQPVALILMLGYVCILGPILEEIIFRGFILKSLQRFGSLFAMILSSILFSLFHGNLVQFIPPFLIGMVLAIMTIKSNSIIPAVIAHIANNSIAMLTDYLVPESSQYYELVNIIYMVAGAIIFLVAVILYWKKFRQIPKGDDTYIKTGKKIGTALTSGWSIGYLIFYVVLVVGGILMATLTKAMTNMIS